MAKKQPKTEADFTVRESFERLKTAGFLQEEDRKAILPNDTGNMEWGDYTFKITVDNMLNLGVLCKYAQMLDFMTLAKGEYELSIDGVVNEVLDEALSKRVRELAKKHGFIDSNDLIESLDGCMDGEEVAQTVSSRDFSRAMVKAAFKANRLGAF